MKLITSSILFMLCAIASFAGPIPPAESVYRSPSLRGGIGFDKQVLRLFATEEEFTGHYFLRIDVRQRKLTNYRLPRVTFTNYCGHYRRSGGSIGDYKPKSIYRTLKISHEPSGQKHAIWTEGRSGQDYNENPVELNIAEFHPRGPKIQIPSDSGLMAMILDKCRSMRPVAHVQMNWETSHSCRWKPEIWHKPAAWADEYYSPIRAKISQNVHLQCVNF